MVRLFWTIWLCISAFTLLLPICSSLASIWAMTLNSTYPADWVWHQMIMSVLWLQPSLLNSTKHGACWFICSGWKPSLMVGFITTIGTVTIGTVTTSDRARHCNWTRLCRSPPRRTLTCELCRRHDPSRPPPRYDQHHKTFLLYLTGHFIVIKCWCSSGWSPYLSDTRPVS